MFRATEVERLSQNYLVIGIEPTEGITLQFNTKVPGPTVAIDGVEMSFKYKDYFRASPSTGYETLIYDWVESPPPEPETAEAAPASSSPRLSSKPEPEAP